MNRGASEHKAAPAFRTLFAPAAAVLLLALVALAGRGAPVSASHGSTPGVVDFVSIDMDTTGNTPTVLGTREVCVSQSVGASFAIDITADEVDPTDKVSAFEFTLNYDSSRLKVTAVDNLQLVASGGGTIPFDVSDSVPDTDGAFYVGFVDLSANYEDGDGVLSRITLESTGAGVSPLTLTGPISGPAVYDQFTFPLTVNTVQNASEAQGVACPTGVVLTVNDPADTNDGTCDAANCTLREAMNAAAAHLGADTITFNASTFPPNAPATISLGADLSALSVSGDTIDGVGAGVIVDGVTDSFPCFTVSGSGNVIKSIELITNCTDGVYVTGAGNTIGGGNVDSDGDTVYNEDPLDGLDNDGDTFLDEDPLEEGNVISGNAVYGVHITTTGAAGNSVKGNFIGTNAAGTAAIPNTSANVDISGGAQTNTVGGSIAGERNLISGTGGNGIQIHGLGTNANFVKGNFVGTDAAGTSALGNARGVSISASAQTNVVGGSTAAERNVISGSLVSAGEGVLIRGSDTNGNVVSGNYIGTNAAGTAAIANVTGVKIDVAAQNNTVGGATAGQRNVISGNSGEGVDILDDGTTGNTVSGNYIGTDAAGTGDLGNGASGIYIRRAQNNTIGGTAPGAGNVISGNDGFAAVAICGNPTFCGGEGSPAPGDASGNVVQGNYIGTNAGGTAAVSNYGFGLSIDGAPDTIVGGAAAGAGNVISGNGRVGLLIFNDATGAIVHGNHIGTSASGTTGIANAEDGVYIVGSANFIGGTAAGAGNVIAYNSMSGVCVAEDTSVGNVIRGNSIFSNVLLGIDLAPTGQACSTGSVNGNDFGDGDSGPNNLQNFPVITSAILGTSSTTISGTLDTIDPDLASVDVYSSIAADGSGYGEGQVYLGSATPDSFGNWTLVIPGTPPYPVLTATATSGNPSTSEFSAPLLPPPGPGPGLPLTAIAYQGESTPIGGTFGTFGPAQVPNIGGDVAFWATVSGGSASQGIFIRSATFPYPITKVVAPGDPAPAPVGGTFTSLGNVPVMNNLNQVVFWGSVAGGTAAQGIFLYSGGTITKIVATGDASPLGPAYSSFLAPLGSPVPVLNNLGDIAFWSTLVTAQQGVFLYSGGSVTKIAATGDPTPAGGTFSTFIIPSGWATIPIVTENRQVSFWGGIAGGPAEGIFLSTEGGLTKIAAAGDPTPLGGTYFAFTRVPSPNDSGEVAFWAVLIGSSAGTCTNIGAQCGVFVKSGGGVASIAAAGDGGPAGVGGTISGLGSAPIINDSGQVTDWASIANGFSGQTLFRYTDGALINVAAIGNSTPIGGTFFDFIDASGFPTAPLPNNVGQVALWGEVSGGAGSEGIFVSDAPAGTQTEVAALAGAAAPGTGGGTFGTSFDLAINSQGTAVFANTVTGSSTGVDAGLFLFFAGSPRQLALEGATAPNSGGATFAAFGPPVNNDNNDVVARVSLSDGRDALYLFFAGAALAGTPRDPVPLAFEDQETGPGTALFFAGFAEPAVNNSGDVIARATVDDVQGPGGTEKQALYLFFAGSPGTPPDLVAIEDDETGTGTALFFAGFAAAASINDLDQVVAKVTVDNGAGGNVRQGVYLFFAGTSVDPQPLALENNGPGPALFFAGFGEHPDINLFGSVVYQTTLDNGMGGNLQTALYVYQQDTGQSMLLAAKGDGAPVGVGGTLSAFDESPAINDHDQVVDRATVTGATNPGVNEGLFLFFAGSPTGRIAAQKDAGGGGTFDSAPPVFPFWAYNNNAQVVYVANVTGGPSPQGVFIATLDTDGDSVLDHLDNCPTVFNKDQNNTDKALQGAGVAVVGDELGNACDNDDDGDSIGDGTDPCPVDADCDGDGLLDGADGDNDNDRYYDTDETGKGSDLFDPLSTPERCDGLDNDGDGSIDEQPPGANWDIDGNTVKDCLDAAVDTDGDGLMNTVDTDDDGDGFSDVKPPSTTTERKLSTDELGACPTGSSHDAWPPDRDHDRDADVGDVIANFNGKINNPPRYDARSDADGDGDDDVGDVIQMYSGGKINTKCARFTWTNNTGGAVNDIHIQWSTAIAAVFSARSSDGGAWSTRTLGGGGLTLDVSRPVGSLASGGSLVIVVRGAAPVVSTCQWTLNGGNAGAC